MGLILDASFIFALLVEEVQSEKAREFYAINTNFIFLDFTKIEVANGLTSALRRGRITIEHAKAANDQLSEIVKSPIAAVNFSSSAFELALSINHPVYDCLYAIAALENGATLVTCDAKFAAKLDASIYHTHVV